MDILIGMTLTTMLSLVLSAMMLAAGDAWNYTTGVEDASQQVRASMDRIEYMVSQAGTYQLAGGPTIPGVAVVERMSGIYRFPEVLVVWSGGRNGGMVNFGTQNRLPVIRELLIYAPQPDDPARFVEIADPNNSSSIDFTAATFASTILAIVDAAASEKVLLSDRVRVSQMPVTVAATNLAGNIRFELFESPTAAELNGVTPGSAEWYNLVWSQGVVCSETGLRQLTVRMEFQLEQQPPNTLRYDSTTITTSAAIPFFGSARYLYAYRP